MAANAGTKLYRVVENLERLLAIEFMAAVQGLEFRNGKTGSSLEKIISEYRTISPAIEEDRIFSQDLAKTIDFLKRIEG
jgi:histidine ammonia-lyase